MKELRPDQAFNVMRLFLEAYFERTESDDVGSLLGDLQILEDGKSSDPAAWEEWLACVQRVLSEDQTIDRDKRL